MTRRQVLVLYLFLIVCVPGLVALGWWYYLPRHQLAAAERALAANQLTQADEILTRLRREEPNNQRAWFLSTQVLRQLGRLPEAETTLAKAMELGLPLSEGRREFALLMAGQQFNLAEGALQQVLKDNPGDVEVLQALAEGYYNKRNWIEAERACTRWLEVQPDRQETLMLRARARTERTRFNEAAEDCREVLRRSPNHFHARLLLAHCLLSTARIAEAEPELLACRTQRPDRPEPLIGLANCALDRGALDQAEELLKNALALDPASLLGLHQLGGLYLQRKRYEIAVPVFDRIVKIDPEDKTAHLNLARALQQTGAQARAKEHERRYEELLKAEEQRLKRGPARPAGSPGSVP